MPADQADREPSTEPLAAGEAESRHESRRPGPALTKYVNFIAVLPANGAHARRAADGTIPPPAHDDDDVRAWFASHVVRDAELWLAVGRAGTVVGVLVLEGPWIDQLHVEPTMTGQGVGSGLLELAKRERPDGLRLWTFASNAGAQRFYARHGFVEAHRFDGRDNEERAPDILYVWSGQGIGD